MRFAHNDDKFTAKIPEKCSYWKQNETMIGTKSSVSIVFFFGFDGCLYNIGGISLTKNIHSM